MDENMKILLGFVTGAVISGGITYICTKKHYEKILAEELEEMREWAYSSKPEFHDDAEVNPMDEEEMDREGYEKVRAPYDKSPFTKPDLSTFLHQQKKSWKDNYDEKEPEEVEEEYYDDLTNLENGTRVYEDEPVKSDEWEMDWENEETQYEEEDEDPNPEGDPYLVSRQEFVEETGFDKDQLTYYAEDDTLIDSDGDVITDVDNLVGYDNLETMKEADLVYVRNERLMMCYEIEILQRSYAEDVLGMKPEPKTRKNKRRNEEDEE